MLQKEQTFSYGQVNIKTLVAPAVELRVPISLLLNFAKTVAARHYQATDQRFRNDTIRWYPSYPEKLKPMSWQNLISHASTIALSLPVIAIFLTRLYTNRHFLLLGIYYLLALGYNLLTSRVLEVNVPLKKFIALIINILDAPLIIGFLLFFTVSWKLTKKIKLAITLFAGFELIVLAIVGWNFNTSAITLGPGILLVLFCSSYFFIQQLQTKPGERNPAGAIMMLSALLFSYGCFLLIYVFHYIIKTPNTTDVFLVFYLVTIFASLLMAAGIWRESRIERHANDALKAGKKSVAGDVQNNLSDFYVDENEFRYK